MAEHDGRPRIADGLAVYESRHEGPRVVLVHGSMDRAASFIKAARRLTELHVVRYDRRGYGRSAGGGPSPSLAGQVDDLLTVVDGRPAAVVGHSLGGLVALRAAQHHPDLIPAVGAFEAPMPWAPWWPSRSAGGDAIRVAAEGDPGDAAERFLRRMIGDERWEALPAATRDARRAEGPALLADLRGARDGGAPYDLESIRQPVVAGRGSRSDAHHRRAADELAAGAPDGELFVIDGAGHAAHASHPEEFATFVRLVRSRARGAATLS